MNAVEFRHKAMIAAMQGIIASPRTDSTATPKEIALAAIEHADALLYAITIDEPVAS